MVLDPAEPRTRDPHMRSFTVTPLDPVGKALLGAGVAFEFAEYLKGETHYIVVTIKKAALLAAGAPPGRGCPGPWVIEAATACNGGCSRL